MQQHLMLKAGVTAEERKWRLPTALLLWASSPAGPLTGKAPHVPGSPSLCPGAPLDTLLDLPSAPLLPSTTSRRHITDSSACSVSNPPPPPGARSQEKSKVGHRQVTGRVAQAPHSTSEGRTPLPSETWPVAQGSLSKRGTMPGHTNVWGLAVLLRGPCSLCAPTATPFLPWGHPDASLQHQATG